MDVLQKYYTEISGSIEFGTKSQSSQFFLRDFYESI